MLVPIRSFPPIECPVLGPEAVHVWVARLNERPDSLPDPARVLTPAELERADRYRHPLAREQFVRARALLRSLLSDYLETEAGSIEIVPRPDGKPIVAGRSAGALEFNLSHTDGLALVAIGRRAVGVDVEKVRAVASIDGLVERFFSPAERVQYRGLPIEFRTAAFFRGWVCKEAVLKGIGCGARELDRCIVDLDPREPVRIAGPVATQRDWAVACWEPASGYVAAVAVEGVDQVELEKAK
jgi:4'-phosphopantetheinyl transferase